MSKIQDAIKKIQSGRVPAEDTMSARSSVESIATLVRSAADESVPPGDDSLVVVDRDCLRTAGLLAPADQERDLADQYRKIKRPLLDLASGRTAHTTDFMNLIMIASALSGDGKTFNCINLALSMATEKDTTVLLVDTDVAKPHISRLFGIDKEPGIIDLLVDENRSIEEVTLRTDVPGLSILPAGQSNEHATELLASKRMAKIIAQLARVYPERIVIFDSPPLLATSEALVLAGLVGQIALVVCADRTPRQAVREALDTLDETKAINLILNQAGTSSDYFDYARYGYGSAIRYNPSEKQS